MKKLLFIRFALPIAGGLSLALLAPASALAADVTLTADTTVVLPGDGLSYTLSSGGTFDLLNISGGTMTFSMVAGESVKITAPGPQVLNNDGGFAYACAAQSTLTLTPAVTSAIIVTPSGTCVPATSAGSGSTGSSSSGGSSTTSATPATPATPASSTAPAVPATPATPATHAPALSAAQIKSILDVLASFNADAATIAKVKASLQGVATGSVTSAAVHVFKSNLTTGSLGSEVKALQQYLNAHGYTVAASGPGSAGNETTRFGNATKDALIKLQKAAGLTPAVGYFGAKTRAYIEAHP